MYEITAEKFLKQTSFQKGDNVWRYENYAANIVWWIIDEESRRNIIDDAQTCLPCDLVALEQFVINEIISREDFKNLMCKVDMILRPEQYDTEESINSGAYQRGE